MSPSSNVVDKSTAATLLANCKTKEDVLTLIVAGSITIEQASARITELLPKASAGPIRFKVSEKGAVSVYGLSKKWPVTLYAGQWDRLLGAVDELKSFIAANKSKLATKESEAS